MTLHLDARQRAMLKEMGVTVWLPGTDFAVATAPTHPSPASRPVPVQAPRAPALAPRAVATEPAPQETPVPVPLPMSVRADEAMPGDWPALVAQVASCQACPQHAGRGRCVLRMESRPAPADWLVVVDPPEEEQERQQLPVTGDVAVLLDNMLKAMGVSRGVSGANGAYVTPVTKCRVPHAVLPTPQDLQQCLTHLRAEIALVQPRMVLLMGRFAQQLVLPAPAAGASVALDHLRGMVHRLEGIPTIVSYPPAILLRNSGTKAKAWADLCLAMDVHDALLRGEEAPLPTIGRGAQ